LPSHSTINEVGRLLSDRLLAVDSNKQRASKALGREGPSYASTFLLRITGLLLVIFVLIVIAYWAGWEWTGFTNALSPVVPKGHVLQPGKTLWDWLQLLIIPAVLAGGTVWFSNRQAEVAARTADDQRAEKTLQSFIDHMSDLILINGLGEPSCSPHVQSMARARTLTTLRNLDSHRKVVLLRFLYDSRLIDEGQTHVDLRGANLNDITLDHTVLPRVSLRGVKMRGATCVGANFTGADFGGADLSDAVLDKAVFRDANLGGRASSNFDLDTVPSLTVTANAVDDLPGARLTRASLTDVVLDNATLDYADFVESNVTDDQIARAKSSTSIAWTSSVAAR